MPDLFLQMRPGYLLAPATPGDLEALKGFMPNQILKAKLAGTLKSRSVEQNGWMHKVFQIVAENTDDPAWNTLEKVKRNVKLAMKFFSDDVTVIDNKVFFELKSFAFHKMSQVEANKVFNEALEICSIKSGISIEKLTEQCKK